MDEEKTYADLKREFNEEVTKLQEECSHKNHTDWLQEDWAPAHPTRYNVKKCKRCNKTVKVKTLCDSCEKEIVKDSKEEFNRGIGVPGMTLNDIFCDSCHNTIFDSIIENRDVSKSELEELLSIREKVLSGEATEEERDRELEIVRKIDDEETKEIVEKVIEDK